MEEETCKHCGREAEGHKCDICGEEAENHNENHICGGSHCVAKCSSCKEAETNCRCERAD